MGILRVYLALCVITAHSEQRIFPWRMHDGVAAVQMFYVISGFYMAMILSSARYKDIRAFYLSRFLRIFLPYWLVLIGVIAWSTLMGLLFHHWLTLQSFAEDPLSKNGAAGFFIATLSNLTLFGQDWVMFLSQDFHKHLSFTAHFENDSHPLWHYLAIPQCWSIGLEITFYALVPYLNRLRSRWLILIAVGASTARIFVYCNMELTEDPWNYRFFPFEIALFVLGMLGYRFYARTNHLYPLIFRLRSNFAYGLGTATLLLVFYIHVYLTYHIHFIRPAIVLYLSNSMLAMAIPFLFFAFGNHAVDRFVGELSYPIYLVHLTIILTLRPVLTVLGVHHHNLLAIASAFFSILLAILLCVFFITPLDKRRHSLTISKSKSNASKRIRGPACSL